MKILPYLFKNYSLLLVLPFRYSHLKWFARRKLRHLMLISIFYILTAVSTYAVFMESYKLNKYISHQCQVTSIDVKWERKNYAGFWNATVMVEGERRNITVKGTLPTRLKSDAWNQSWNRSGSPAPVRPDRTRPDETGFLPD